MKKMTRTTIFSPAECPGKCTKIEGDSSTISYMQVQKCCPGKCTKIEEDSSTISYTQVETACQNRIQSRQSSGQPPGGLLNKQRAEISDRMRLHKKQAPGMKVTECGRTRGDIP